MERKYEPFSLLTCDRVESRREERKAERMRENRMRERTGERRSAVKTRVDAGQIEIEFGHTVL